MVHQNLIASVRVDLKNTEGIALGIHEVPLPAGFGHREFWKSEEQRFRQAARLFLQ
jgi:hypothetical protein